MDWQDNGVLLTARPHGETAAILEVFTARHGRHMGVLPGGASRKRAAMLQPGTQLQLTWRARLDDHMGTWAAEPLAQRAAILSDANALHALGSATALLHLGLPERQTHDRLYAATLTLFDVLNDGAGQTTAWGADYLAWELLLLEDIGFGLDLTACAVTGATEDLVFVSPRTGRAVSRAGAGDWAARLLPLPPLARGQGPATPAAVAEGLALTGHFLALALAPQLGDRPLPDARARLLRALAKL